MMLAQYLVQLLCKALNNGFFLIKLVTQFPFLLLEHINSLVYAVLQLIVVFYFQVQLVPQLVQLDSLLLNLFLSDVLLV